jgi:hypothetical protein
VTEHLTEHLTSEDLVLRHYGELTPADAARVDDHLGACVTCAGNWEELRAALAMVTTVAPPEPRASFEHDIWARVQPALAAQRSRWTLRQLVPVGVWAALVLGVIWVQASPQIEAPPTEQAATPSEPSVAAHRRVLFTALDEHLAQTEILLVEVMNAPHDAQPAFAFERLTAADLVASGRLYRDTARQTGDLHLVAMLDELEGVLVDLAHGPVAPAREDVDLWRARIDAGDLLFKVRAVTTDIRDQQARPHAEGE